MSKQFKYWGLHNRWTPLQTVQCRVGLLIYECTGHFDPRHDFCGASRITEHGNTRGLSMLKAWVSQRILLEVWITKCLTHFMKNFYSFWRKLGQPVCKIPLCPQTSLSTMFATWATRHLKKLQQIIKVASKNIGLWRTKFNWMWLRRSRIQIQLHRQRRVQSSMCTCQYWDQRLSLEKQICRFVSSQTLSPWWKTFRKSCKWRWILSWNNCKMHTTHNPGPRLNFQNLHKR